LLHIESRSSKRHEASYDFFVEMDTRGTGDVNGALEEIKADATHFNVISREYKDNAGRTKTKKNNLGNLHVNFFLKVMTK
jgi:prephenate dehydratase